MRRAQRIVRVLNVSGPALTANRWIYVPPQLKAYGSVFSQNSLTRSDHMPQHLVLTPIAPVENRLDWAYVDDFQDMCIPQCIRNALNEMQVFTPSPIQQLSIPAVLREKNVLIASPSGTGKTLAFLVPLYTKMLSDRDVYQIPLRERRPRLIILSPTRELSFQIASVAQVLGKHTGLKSIVLMSEKRRNRAWRRLLNSTMPDVVIMHPTALMGLICHRRLFIDDLRYLAIDEADTLVSPEHRCAALLIASVVKKRIVYRHLWPVETQFVFSTSIVTTQLRHLVKKMPCVFAADPQTHHSPPSLRHKFIPAREKEKIDILCYILNKSGNPPEREEGDDVPGANVNSPRLQFHNESATSFLPTPTEPAGGKSQVVPVAPKAPQKLRWEDITAYAAPFTCHIPRVYELLPHGKRVLIFFRSNRCCLAVYLKLRYLGYNVSYLSANLDFVSRKENFEEWASGRCNILCATDLAARGIDTDVQIVVNFDMPSEAVRYVTRAGRAARMGRQGQVVSLFTPRQRVIATSVAALQRRGEPLEDISNWRGHVEHPRYGEWRRERRNAIARRYVSLISSRTIPAHHEKTYLKHYATWRPLWKPKSVAMHFGINPQKQHKILDSVTHAAIWARRQVLAKKKGKKARFGYSHGPVLFDGVQPSYVEGPEQSADDAEADLQ